MKHGCGHPMSRLDVINCANSLITGSTLVTAMNCLHQSNSKYPTIEFGITWYRKFMRRNNNKIKNRRDERQNQLKKDWTRHENFITVYDLIYTLMVDAKVANPLENQINTSSIEPAAESRQRDRLQAIISSIV